MNNCNYGFNSLTLEKDEEFNVNLICNTHFTFSRMNNISLPGIMLDYNNGSFYGKPTNISDPIVVFVYLFAVSDVSGNNIHVISFNLQIVNSLPLIPGVIMDIIFYSQSKLLSESEFNLYDIYTSRKINTIDLYSPKQIEEFNKIKVREHYALRIYGIFEAPYDDNFTFLFEANDKYLFNFKKYPDKYIKHENHQYNQSELNIELSKSLYSFVIITNRCSNLNVFKLYWKCDNYEDCEEYKLLSIPYIFSKPTFISNMRYSQEYIIIRESSIFYPLYSGIVTSYTTNNTLPKGITLNKNTGEITTSLNIVSSFTTLIIMNNTKCIVGVPITFINIDYKINGNGIMSSFYSIKNKDDLDINDFTLSTPNMYILSKRLSISELYYPTDTKIWDDLPSDISLPFVGEWKSLVFFPISWNYCIYSTMKSYSYILIDDKIVYEQNSNDLISDYNCTFINNGYHDFKIVSFIYAYNSPFDVNINATSPTIMEKIDVKTFYNPPTFSDSPFYYNDNVVVYYFNNTIPENIPIYSGLYPKRFTVSPIFNFGLTISDKGIISGKPTLKYMPKTEYIITLKDNASEYYTKIIISILEVTPPKSLKYDVSIIECVIGSEFSLIPKYTGIINYFTSTILPDGIAINPITGEIYGTACEYFNDNIEIRGYNEGGYISYNISMEITNSTKCEYDIIKLYYSFSDYKQQIINVTSDDNEIVFYDIGRNRSKTVFFCTNIENSLTLNIKHSIEDDPYIILMYYPDILIYEGYPDNNYNITFTMDYDLPEKIDIDDVTLIEYSDSYIEPEIIGPYSYCEISPNLPLNLFFDNETCEISGVPIETMTKTNYTIKLVNPDGFIKKDFLIQVKSCSNGYENIKLALTNLNKDINYNLFLINSKGDIEKTIYIQSSYDNKKYMCLKVDNYTVEINATNENIQKSNIDSQLTIYSINNHILYYQPLNIIYSTKQSGFSLYFNVSKDTTIYYSDHYYEGWYLDDFNYTFLFKSTKQSLLPIYSNIVRYYIIPININISVFYSSSIFSYSITYYEGIKIYLNGINIFTDGLPSIVDNTTAGIDHSDSYITSFYTSSVLNFNQSVNYIGIEVHRKENIKNEKDYIYFNLKIYNEICYSYIKIPTILTSNIDNIPLYNLLNEDEKLIIYIDPYNSFILNITYPHNNYIMVNRYTITLTNDYSSINSISWYLYAYKNNKKILLDVQSHIIFQDYNYSQSFYLNTRGDSYNQYQLEFKQDENDKTSEFVLSLNEILLEACNIQFCSYEGHNPVRIGEKITLSCPEGESGGIILTCLLNLETKTPYWEEPVNNCTINPPSIFEIIPNTVFAYNGYPISESDLMCIGKSLKYNSEPPLPQDIVILQNRISGTSSIPIADIYNISCCNSGGCLYRSYNLTISFAVCYEDPPFPETIVGNKSIIPCEPPKIGTIERSCYFNLYPVWGVQSDNCVMPDINDSKLGIIIAISLSILTVIALITGCALYFRHIKTTQQSLVNRPSKSYSTSTNLSEFGFIR